MNSGTLLGPVVVVHLMWTVLWVLTGEETSR